MTTGNVTGYTTNDWWFNFSKAVLDAVLISCKKIKFVRKLFSNLRPRSGAALVSHTVRTIPPQMVHPIWYLWNSSPTKSTCIYPKLKVGTLEKLNYGTSKAARFALEISLVYPLKSSNLFNFREGRQRYATEWEPFHITLETTKKKLHTLLCF